MSHGDHDKSFQQGELSHENSIRYKARVFRGDQANFPGAEGDVLDRIEVDLFVEDPGDNWAVGEGVVSSAQAE